MHRLEHPDFGTEVCRGHDAESAHQACTEIRHDVSVQIGQQQHVELLRLHHEMHARGIDDAVVLRDIRIMRRDVLHALEEEPVAHLHDVRLVHGRDAFSAMAARVVEREFRNARRRLERDDLQALDHARHDLVLEAGIEILGVLAHDHEIHALIARGDRRNVPDRPQVREQFQRLPQADVHARESAAHWRRQRPFERNFVSGNRFEQLRRQRRTVLGNRARAGQMRLPLDVEAGGFDDLYDHGGNFGADSVARDQRDAVLRHVVIRALPSRAAPGRRRC